MGAMATYGSDRSFGQPRHQFLDVADTLSTSDGRSKPGSVPELQVKPTRGTVRTDWRDCGQDQAEASRIIKPFPFLFREQQTEARVTQGDSLRAKTRMNSAEFPQWAGVLCHTSYAHMFCIA